MKKFGIISSVLGTILQIAFAQAAMADCNVKQVLACEIDGSQVQTQDVTFSAGDIQAVQGDQCLATISLDTPVGKFSATYDQTKGTLVGSMNQSDEVLSETKITPSTLYYGFADGGGVEGYDRFDIGCNIH